MEDRETPFLYLEMCDTSGDEYAAASSMNRISSSLSLSTSTDRPSDCSSLMSTLKLSGTPGGWMSSPFTMAS